MNRIILVSATPLEHGGLKDISSVPIFQTGIGKINSAMNLTEIILNEKPDLVVNFGSCGNLKNHKVGEIIEVGEVYSNDGIIDITVSDLNGVLQNNVIISLVRDIAKLVNTILEFTFLEIE